MSARAPYRQGDLAKVLYFDEQYGTCLARATVVAIAAEPVDGLWFVRFRVSDGQYRESKVRADGTDRHGYVERVR